MRFALDLSGVDILLVDDDPTLRRILRRTLAEFGARVTEVEAGARGLVELKRARDAGAPYRVIFLDAGLAGVSGFEIAERLRQYPQELRGVILLLGPGPQRSELARTRDLGAGAHLERPFNRPDLLNALAAVTSVPAVMKEPAGDPPQVHILLAEDSTESRQIIGHYLESPDVQIDLAENGAVALEMFRLADYDVVLMDIQMPVFDGYRSMQEMRAWEQKQGLRRSPVIAMTAFADTEYVQKCLRAGFDGYLTKPVQKEKLLAALRRHVRG